MYLLILLKINTELKFSFMGKSIKLGTFNNPEEAFKRYKVYKEDLIQDMAEQYKGQIPDKAYRAMLNWKVEITD